MHLDGALRGVVGGEPNTPVMLRRARAVPLLALVLAGPAAGCGTGDDRREVRAVTQRFFTALAAHDGAQACAQLSEDTAKALEDQAKSSCREAVTELDLSGSRVRAVQVFLTSARVDLADGESAYLDRARVGWRLSAVGCRAQEGRPRDRPLECEAEA
jgi:hypothetical protein